VTAFCCCLLLLSAVCLCVYVCLCRAQEQTRFSTVAWHHTLNNNEGGLSIKKHVACTYSSMTSGHSGTSSSVYS
jgi:hypothetical protein